MTKLKALQCFSERFFHWLRRQSSWLVCGLLVACTSTTAGTDTRTNWLSSCATDDACGSGLSCVCGVCTQACAAPTDCSSLGIGASCFEVQGCSAAGQVCARSDFGLSAFNQDLADAADASASVSVPHTPSSGAVSNSAPSGSGTDDIGPGPQLSSTTTSDLAGDASLDASSADAGSVTSSSGSTSTAVSSTAVSSTAVSSTATTSSSADLDPVCDAPGRVYVSHNPAECTTVAECGIVAEGNGNVPFNDSCGCGCKPYVPPVPVDGFLETGCNGPSSGGALSLAVVADSELSGVTTCFDIPNAIIRSDAELAAWVSDSGCSDVADAVSIVNFETQTLVIVGIQDRPLAHLAYSVQGLDGRIHLGVQANAYCGGARPPWGFVAVALDATSNPVQISIDTCLDDCVLDGGAPPP